MSNLTQEQVISLVSQIGDEERHFNELEKSYRLLASQWLLAALGVMGYLLQSDNTMLFDKMLLIALVGAAGNVGIFLLWLIDIRVYHRLLNCAFLQGIKLEQEHDWLPKLRTDMLLSQETGDVVRTTGLYYICSCGLLILISAIALVNYFNDNIILISAVIVFALLLTLLQVRYMKRAGINHRAQEVYNNLKPGYHDAVVMPAG